MYSTFKETLNMRIGEIRLDCLVCWFEWLRMLLTALAYTCSYSSVSVQLFRGADESPAQRLLPSLLRTYCCCLTTLRCGCMRLCHCVFVLYCYVIKIPSMLNILCILLLHLRTAISVART